MVKVIAAFAAGVAAGCVGTYLYMKKYVIEGEFIEVTKNEPEEVEEKINPEEEMEIQKDANSISDLMGYSSIKTYPDVEGAVTPEEREDEVVKLNAVDTDVRKGSYSITLEEYETTHPEYEKVICQLYMEDETLVMEEGDELLDPSNTIGDDIFNKFIETDDDIRYIYVRNDELGIDWEVCRNEQSYKRLMGLEE